MYVNFIISFWSLHLRLSALFIFALSFSLPPIFCVKQHQHHDFIWSLDILVFYTFLAPVPFLFGSSKTFYSCILLHSPSFTHTHAHMQVLHNRVTPGGQNKACAVNRTCGEKTGRDTRGEGLGVDTLQQAKTQCWWRFNKIEQYVTTWSKLYLSNRNGFFTLTDFAVVFILNVLNLTEYIYEIVLI